MKRSGILPHFIYLVVKSMEKKEEMNKIKDSEVRSEESYRDNSNNAVSYVKACKTQTALLNCIIITYNSGV